MNRLVILAPNWIGDAVMAQPAIADIRRAFPGATMTLAARPSVASLRPLMPEVDDVTPVGALGEGRFDVAIILPNSFRSALAASRARIPERWGYRADWRGPLLTRAVPRVAGVHQVESYRQLVAALGCENASSVPRLTVPDVYREHGAAELGAAGWDGRTPLVALAPGAAFGSAKRWPADYFAELAQALEADGVQSVLVGGRADMGVGDAIRAARRSAGPMLNLIGANDVAGMAGVFTHCRALVSNDSGAMHVGAAVGLPVTAAFGPTDERLTAPRGVGHHVLTNPVWCRPCMLRECPLDHQCMRGIGVPSMAEATLRTLQQ